MNFHWILMGSNSPEYMSAYYQKNKEKLKQDARAYYLANREKRMAYFRSNYLANPARAMWSNRKRKYGVDEETYRAMAADQDGRCAICSEEKELVVDHSHLTKKTRGLLCERCNFLLAALDADGGSWLPRAQEYLAAHS